MTQEEKAKAYDEALKRAKKATQAGGDVAMDIIQYIFPQLKESEDERIRKALIDGVRQIRCKGDVTQEQMLAYLERQKDKMTKDEFENSDLFQLKLKTKYADGYQDGMIQQQEKQKELPFVKDVVLGLPGLYFYDGERMHFQGSPAIEEKQKESEDVSVSTMIPSCWTEKQKEHAPIPDKFSGLKSLMLQYLQSAANRKDDAEIEDDTDLWGRKILDYVWKHTDMQKEQKPILEVFGFKVGDAVRLKDGDGRKHIIKSFEEVEGLHGPNFYHVEFEDDSARDSIYPGEEYPNGYYTQMEKFEKEQKPELYYDKELDIAAREFYLSGGADSPVDSTGLVPIVRMAEFGATWMKERMQKEQPTDAKCEDRSQKHNISVDDIAQDYVDGVKEYNSEPTWDLMQTAVCYGYHLAEQKPNIELIKKSWYMEGYHDKEFNCEPKWIIKTGEGGPRYEENPKYGQIIEQKPAEWSKEDERKLQRCIEIVECWEGDYDIAYTPYSNFLKSLRPQSKQKQNDYITPHKEFFKFIYDRLINVHKENPNVDYMRSFKERLNNLSFGEKQEWSEEDEKRFKRVLEIIDRHGTVPVFDGKVEKRFNAEYIWLKNLRERLKSSRSQPQRRDTYYDIIHGILDMLKGIDFTQITPEHRVSLLNDIRVKCKNADECAAILDEPSWKPSEAQLMALHSMIDDESDTIGNEQLKLLYNDLKKL